LAAGGPPDRHAARTQAINALRALLVTAPTELREQLRGRSATRLVRAAGDLEPGPITSPQAAAMLALHTSPGAPRPCRPRSPRAPPSWSGAPAPPRPSWRRCSGVGADSAGALLVAAGDNPGRLRSDACFAMLRRRPDPGVLGQQDSASAQSGW
jgi:transposase